jgi:hypothetical protein
MTEEKHGKEDSVLIANHNRRVCNLPNQLAKLALYPGNIYEIPRAAACSQAQAVSNLLMASSASSESQARARRWSPRALSHGSSAGTAAAASSCCYACPRPPHPPIPQQLFIYPAVPPKGETRYYALTTRALPLPIHSHSPCQVTKLTP